MNVTDLGVRVFRLVWPPKAGDDNDELHQWRRVVSLMVLAIGFVLVAHLAYTKGLLADVVFFGAPAMATTADLAEVEDRLSGKIDYVHHEAHSAVKEAADVMEAWQQEYRGDRAADLVTDIVRLKMEQCREKVAGNTRLVEVLTEQIERRKEEYRVMTGSEYREFSC